VAAVLLHFSTGHGFAFARTTTSGESYAVYAVLQYAVWKQHTIHPNSNTSSSDEGHGSHFALSLEWSKSLHSFALTTNDRSV